MSYIRSYGFQDRFATGRTRPPIDGIQNVELLSFSEADGWTSLEVRRKLAACESNDRNIEVACNCNVRFVFVPSHTST